MSQEVVPSAGADYCLFAPVPPMELATVMEMYNKESLERSTENNSVIPERYRNPTDITAQKRLINDIKKNKGTRKCYTCFPKRLAKEHTFVVDSTNKVKFHFDMCNRPLIIATPFKHINTILDFDTQEETVQFFTSIKNFCNFWNIKDYQIQINHGNWQHHEHLHAKIRANEDSIHKIRQDHFKLIKMQKDRTADTSSV
tara:strand:- start:2683 stop:3279 length:597 start_codon:yes stop_codon:yes gene_type:complete